LKKIDSKQIDKLTSLTSLNVAYNQIEDLNFIKNLPDLFALNASCNRVKSIKFNGELKYLEIFDMRENLLETTEDFEFMFPKIMTIDISDNMLKSKKELLFLKFLDQLIEVHF